MLFKDKLYQSFINKAKLKHNNKFDYSLVEYKNNRVNIEIICPIHGKFEQTPSTHLKSHGCQLCFFDSLHSTRTKGIDTFISEANIKHNNKFDYSLVEYKNNKTNVKIICPEHGVFEQSPEVHLKGKYGCPKCVFDIQKNEKADSVDDFIDKSRFIHGDKYDYSLVNYVNAKSLVKIICPKHGEFDQLPDNHIRKSYGCSKCSSCGISRPENDLINFIKSIESNVESSVNNIIPPKDIDIYIPSKKIGFEFDGLYWHSELHKDKNYHLNKTNGCESKDVRLIHVFEDEWLYKQDIVKSRIKNILGITENKIYARKCEIKVVNSKESKCFLNENHIQGNVNSKVKLGLYYNDELVSLMTFGNLRKNLNQKKGYDIYELLRFCNKLNTTVTGGASRLLKHFIKNYNPKEIISYADRRWSNGDLYEKLGFDFVHNSSVNYFYIINNKRENRFNYRKDVLVKEGYDKGLTEHNIMLDRKIYRIYDCGTKKYILYI